MYQFSEAISRTALFHFKRKWIMDRNWAILPSSSKAVFPVIAAHVDIKTGKAFPEQRTIAILSGITDKMVREGFRGLDGFPSYSREPYITRGGRRSWKHSLQLPKVHIPGETYPFFRYIIDSGCWREAKPTAKALYPVMRHFAEFDFETYQELTDADDDLSEFEDVFRDRDFDICAAEISIMATYAGITRQSVYSALRDLERCSLIERIDNQQWKVFLRTNGSIFRRDYLNEKIRQAYGYAL